MKHIWITVLIVFSLPLFAQEAEKLEVATDLQKKIISNLERDISNYHRSIRKLGPYLKKAGLIKNNISRIPLRSEPRSFYGPLERKIYSLEALVHWTDSGQLSFIQFKERDAIKGTAIRNNRYWYGKMLVNQHNSEPDKTVLEGYAIDFLSFTQDSLQTFDGKLFRVFTGSDLRDKQEFGKAPQIELNTEIQVVKVAQAKNRIKILQEYQPLMLILEHRIRYFVRDQLDLEEKLDDLLPKDYLNP